MPKKSEDQRLIATIYRLFATRISGNVLNLGSISLLLWTVDLPDYGRYVIDVAICSGILLLIGSFPSAYLKFSAQIKSAHIKQSLFSLLSLAQLSAVAVWALPLASYTLFSAKNEGVPSADFENYELLRLLVFLVVYIKAVFELNNARAISLGERSAGEKTFFLVSAGQFLAVVGISFLDLTGVSNLIYYAAGQVITWSGGLIVIKSMMRLKYQNTTHYEPGYGRRRKIFNSLRVRVLQGYSAPLFVVSLASFLRDYLPTYILAGFSMYGDAGILDLIRKAFVTVLRSFKRVYHVFFGDLSNGIGARARSNIEELTSKLFSYQFYITVAIFLASAAGLAIVSLAEAQLTGPYTGALLATLLLLAVTSLSSAGTTLLNAGDAQRQNMAISVFRMVVYCILLFFLVYLNQVTLVSLIVCDLIAVAICAFWIRLEIKRLHYRISVIYDRYVTKTLVLCFSFLCYAVLII